MITTVMARRAMPIVMAFAEMNLTTTAMHPKKKSATADSTATRMEDGRELIVAMYERME
jgi:hypothetical protein